MVQTNDTVARCKRAFMWLIIGNLLTFWIPVLLCAWLSIHFTDADECYKSVMIATNALTVCLFVSPFFLAIPFAIFLHKLIKVLKGPKYGLWVCLPVSVIPVCGLIMYAVLFQKAAQAMGEDLEQVPDILPVRRCRCGGLMKVTSSTQWRKLIRGDSSGYVLNFQCPDCTRKIRVPSGLMVFQSLLGLVVFGLGFILGLPNALKKNQPDEYFAVGVVFLISFACGFSFFKAMWIKRKFPIVRVEEKTDSNPA